MKTSRRGFGKQLGLAIGALPVVSLTGVNAQERKRKKLTGDPITVGGGGGKRKHRGRRALPPPPPEPVYLAFDDSIYRPSGLLGKKTFQHVTPTTYMKQLVITINEVVFDLTSFLPADGEAHVKLDGKGNDEDIEIWGDKPVRIKFHPGKYPKSGRVYRSTDQENFIKKVSVSTPLGSFERGGLTAQDSITIETGTS